jgi:quinol monooxygenase YgiN
MGVHMISALTTFQVEKGMEKIFEATFAELQAEVIGRESGTVGYQLYQAVGKSRLYKVIAHFRDEAAMEMHNSGLALKAIWKSLYAACERTPEVEIFRAV